ncbi:MAG TPA: histidinol dehydrogenase [Candidatus Xenobia bacterium]|jgi:phosphoribosyl-ATP pyrophosphohydrolase/phosphoribosyl-AMP cyclohydrolase/histidinol dehydrogenase
MSGFARRTVEEVVATRRQAVDAPTLAQAAPIVEAVRTWGQDALLQHAERLGDIQPGDPWLLQPDVLQTAWRGLSADIQGVLRRSADRIQAFAAAQRGCLQDLTYPVPGGTAGHTVAAVERAGCYAPGGRYPLPSSVLMTACCARAAGVGTVWVASPKPSPVTLAAAYVAGVDGFMALGGAQAIAAMAYGAGPVPQCDVIVGPGNRWVTAAKQLVSGQVGIDMLAGPSELVVFADAGANPETVAADLLAQAEHDPDALPVLVTTDAALCDKVNAEVVRQLEILPTREVAGAAVHHGFAVVVASLDEGIEVCNRLAPEHLELALADPEAVVSRLLHYGGLFVGGLSAEVFGDYAAGPNHVLPTGGTARHTGGLSVFTFLRVRTWLRLKDARASAALAQDAVTLARLEGLEGHARSALQRLPQETGRGAGK